MTNMKLETTKTMIFDGLSIEGKSITLRSTPEDFAAFQKRLMSSEPGELPFNPPFEPQRCDIRGTGEDEFTPERLREIGGMVGCRVRLTNTIEFLTEEPV